MTLQEYQEAIGRIPMGPWGPLGGTGFFRITVPQRPAAPSPAPARRTARDEEVSKRLERHRVDAEHDRVVARLRRLR